MHYNLCVDCALAHANADFTGMDDDTETRVRAGMERTGHLCVDRDSYSEFSMSRCDGCLSTLGGSRYEASK